ncbi:MAG: hypothetical protein M1831_002834 [Alyxoria varia]|nr:MAG: hypothetical protein M1831_002834 [Alyxoria varia]
MFSTFSLPLTWLPSAPAIGRRTINLSNVKRHDVETSKDRSARSLKHLIKANHANHSIIYHNLEFHNHAPHILGSAYILGANPDQLTKIYEVESDSLEPWRDSPGEISKALYEFKEAKKCLPSYQRAFIDFFEDQLAAFGYDWDKVLNFYLYEGKEPLVNSLVSGLAHPLIHLGYAHELSSRDVGLEALALTACFYNDLHKYLDDPSYTRPPTFKSKNLLEILAKVRSDDRFDGLFVQKGEENIDTVLEQREDALIDYWNAWDLGSNPKAQFEDSQRAATALVVATHDSLKRYDFFLMHLLTSSHAVRILLPIVPPKFQIPLVRQWWLFTLLAYTGQMRPKIETSLIEEYPLNGKNWKDVDQMALTSEHAQDAHYVKGLRSMKEAAATWGDKDDYFLKAAVKFGVEFDSWF